MQVIDQIVTKYTHLLLRNSQLKEADDLLTGLFAAAMAKSIKRDKQLSLFAEHSMIASPRC